MWIQNSSTSDGSHFKSVAEEVTFAVGETTASVNVTLLEVKYISEPPEMFTAILKSNETDVLLADKFAYVTILIKNGETYSV